MESMRGRNERISDKNADAIDSFLNKHPELELTSYASSIEGRERILMYVAPKGMLVPTAFAETLLAYQAKAVLIHEAGNIGRHDCVRVAGDANLALRGKHPDLEFNTVSAQGRGAPVPFFESMGFRHHAMNMATLRNGEVIAFDLTAHYNMDAERGRYDAFAIAAPDEKELKKNLKEFYGVSWE